MIDTFLMLSLIAAMSGNGVIGKGNTLPWDLPDDLRYFRDTTRGKDVLMGRKCYESIGRLLPGRKNIILTRDESYEVPGATVVHTKEEALEVMAEDAFVIGGAEIYRMFLPDTQRLYLTRVHAEVAGDVVFPEIPWQEFRNVSRLRHEADERHAYAFTFEVWDRV